MIQNVQNDAGLKAQLHDFVHGTRIETRRRRRDGRWWWVLGLIGWAASEKHEISPDWVRQGTQIQEALPSASKELLPEIFSLGEALEKLPMMEGRRNEHRKANRMTFELQEALFITLNRLLAHRSPQELVLLDGPQRAFLRRAIFRTADSAFIACALLVLATLQDAALHPQAQELADHHPSERIREAAGEYLRSQTSVTA